MPRIPRPRLGPDGPRPWHAALAGALSLALLPVLAAVGAPAPAAAAASSVTVSPAAPVGGNDFATQALGDAWDFDSPSDLQLVEGVTMADLAGATIAGGRLVVDARGGGFVAPVVSFDDLGAVPWGRDGSLIPIDANRFTRLSVHMNVDRAASGTLMWFTCGLATGSCQGSKDFSTTPGWRTYDVPLTSGTSGDAWRGAIKGLRFYPSNPGGHAEIDWIRLYSPGGTATVQVADTTPGTAPQVIWDADADAGNNTGANPAWGRLDTAGSGARRTFDAGVLPSGTYRVGVVDDGRTTYAPAPVVVNGPPAPEVLDPDRTGGLDYATLAGNPWDFSDNGDLYRAGNADVVIANGVLTGRNRGPLVNDPHVILSQYGPIDGSRFHRLTVRMGHDGPWGLEDAPGGGMNSRIVWTVPPDPSLAQVSDDLVVFPGWYAHTLDLATSPPQAILEPGTPGQAGWAGQRIEMFRIDPNEDRGARQWYLDDVRLAEDDTAYGGTFDIRFRDLDWQPGTTATVRADTDRTGCDGAVVARDVAVTAGVNAVRWAPRPIPSGTYWICTTLSDGTSSTSAYATGPLQMTSRPGPQLAGGDPFGSLDAVQRTPGTLTVSGWAIDPDTTDPVDVHVYVGARGTATRAAATRADVGRAYPVYGAEHGFSATVPVTPGTFDVCAYAINVGDGATRALGCRPYTVGSDPVGNVDRVRPVPGGVRFEGWAFDPDTTASVGVHAYAGASGTATVANASRPDVAAAYPGFGAAHGFAVTAPVTAGGPQNLCAYAINEWHGSTAALGCTRSDVRVDPFGSLDGVTRVAGGVRVRGWSLDPSTAASTVVHVYVGAAGTAVRADQSRPDVAAAYPEWAAQPHGFDTVVPAPAGPVRVCAYGINEGPGTNALLACRDV